MRIDWAHHFDHLLSENINSRRAITELLCTFMVRIKSHLKIIKIYFQKNLYAFLDWLKINQKLLRKQ